MYEVAAPPRSTVQAVASTRSRVSQTTNRDARCQIVRIEDNIQPNLTNLISVRLPKASKSQVSVTAPVGPVRARMLPWPS